jgi:membrane protease YdiL (CAAX protease family)
MQKQRVEAFRMYDGISPPPADQARASRSRAGFELLLFFGLAFTLTWAILGAYIAWPKTLTAHLGSMKTGSPVFFVVVFAPTLSALALTLAREGWPGLVGIGRSSIRVAGRWWWVLLSLVGYPLICAMISAFAGGKSLASVAYQDWYAVLPAVILSGFIFHDAGPLGEELGWRGYALPRLLRLMGPRQAALLLGAIWAIWHIPAFFLSGLSQSRFQFGDFFFQVISFSVFMTLIFIHTRGSVLLAGILPHMWFNAVSKAGIHPIGWVTVALATGLLLGGRSLWTRADAIGEPSGDRLKRK